MLQTPTRGTVIYPYNQKSSLHSWPRGSNHLHILLDHHLSPPPHLVGDEDDGDLFGGAHLGDQVAVLHRLVEAVPAKGKIIASCC